MPIDDFLTGVLGTLRGHAEVSGERWRDVLNKWRDQTLTPLELFDAVGEQIVDNWTTFLDTSGFPGSPVLPTISIRGPFNGLAPLVGQAFASARLVGAGGMVATPMQQIGGAQTFGDGPDVVMGNPAFTAVRTGNFKGEILVTMEQNAPAAGFYSGMVLIGVTRMPVAWVFVEATP